MFFPPICFFLFKRRSFLTFTYHIKYYNFDQVLKLKSGEQIGVLRGHKRSIWCVRFSPIDKCIVTGSADSTVKLWALNNFTCVKVFKDPLSI